AVSGVGEWPVRAEGARSGGPPSVDGGFLARFARAPSRPSAVLPRSTSVSRGRSPFCSRTLPAFGRSPPFHCRFTGEKSVLFAPPPGLWPFSPVRLPFHGGEVRFVRAPSR